MKVILLNVILAGACLCIFMPCNICEGIEHEGGDEIFSLSNMRQDPLSPKVGDPILLPNGEYDVILEVMPDGRIRTMNKSVISENGEVLEGRYKGETAQLNKEIPTIAVTPLSPEKFSSDKELKEDQKEVDRILASFLEKERREKAAMAKESKVDAQKDVSIEDILAFEEESYASAQETAKEQKSKSKRNTGESGASSASKNLRIPKGAAKRNDLSFMSGCWWRRVHSTDGRRIDRECLCMNKKGKTGKVYYTLNAGNRMLCKATVNVRLLSDKQLVYSTNHSICSNNKGTITGVPVYCTQGSSDLMCSWSIGGGSAGNKTFKYPFTRVNSCPR